MFDLDKLNSATKYPSIETYHFLEKGILADERTAFDDVDDEVEVVLTEKVDGTNTRIVLLPDGDWFIGSREELLTAKGDRVYNPAQGIVEAALPLMKNIRINETGSDFAQVLYLETYGHKIGGQAKQYTGDGKVGHRLFDVAYVPLIVLDNSREDIAAWRDGGGQRWAIEASLQWIARNNNLELTPRLGTVKAGEMPVFLDSTHEWLGKLLPSTQVALDSAGLGKAEGIVLRTTDRKVIAKARFEDYERTMRRQQGKKR
jgi:hypothetical protein